MAHKVILICDRCKCEGEQGKVGWKLRQVQVDGEQAQVPNYSYWLCPDCIEEVKEYCIGLDLPATKQ